MNEHRSFVAMFIPSILCALLFASKPLHAQQASTLCRFTSGLRAGTTQDFAGFHPLPIGAACQDGRGSSGFIIAPDSVNGPWRQAYIRRSGLPSDPGAQDTPVTCWAASIAYIFAYYDHRVSQDRIATRYYPRTPHTADPLVMSSALNDSWIDSHGNSFAVTSGFTDRFSGLGDDVTNQDVVDALTDNHPVFFANTHHAMVLLSVRYRETQSGPYIADGEVWDPLPDYHRGAQGGIRKISGTDLQALFAAIPKIEEGGGSNNHSSDDKQALDGSSTTTSTLVVDSDLVETGPTFPSPTQDAIASEDRIFIGQLAKMLASDANNQPPADLIEYGGVIYYKFGLLFAGKYHACAYVRSDSTPAKHPDCTILWTKSRERALSAYARLVNDVRAAFSSTCKVEEETTPVVFQGGTSLGTIRLVCNQQRVTFSFTSHDDGYLIHMRTAKKVTASP